MLKMWGMRLLKTLQLILGLYIIVGGIIFILDPNPTHTISDKFLFVVAMTVTAIESGVMEIGAFLRGPVMVWHLLALGVVLYVALRISPE